MLQSITEQNHSSCDKKASFAEGSCVISKRVGLLWANTSAAANCRGTQEVPFRFFGHFSWGAVLESLVVVKAPIKMANLGMMYMDPIALRTLLRIRSTVL